MQDDTNRLMREWLDPTRVPTEAEIRQVLDHVAKAPFSTRMVPVDRRAVGRVFQGKQLAKTEPSITAHLAKRVLIEKQWAADVTPDEYLAHIHSAVLDAEVRKAVYLGKDGRLYAGCLSPNRLSSGRLGEDPKEFLWIVYAVAYGTIVTGYQVSGLGTISLPPVVRWL